MSGDRSERGQALVEFSFGIIVFIMLFIGMIDLARGVFMFNGVSQAAGEIARETSIYPGNGALGASPESVAIYQVQRGLVPGLTVTASDFQCYDISGVLQVDSCKPGDWVRVTARTTFVPAIPFVAGLGPFVLSSTSSAELQ